MEVLGTYTFIYLLAYEGNRSKGLRITDKSIKKFIYDLNGILA